MDFKHNLVLCPDQTRLASSTKSGCYIPSFSVPLSAFLSFPFLDSHKRSHARPSLMLTESKREQADLENG